MMILRLLLSTRITLCGVLPMLITMVGSAVAFHLGPFARDVRSHGSFRVGNHRHDGMPMRTLPLSYTRIWANIIVYDQAEQVAYEVCHKLKRKAERCIEEHGSFDFAIPGGSILSMLGQGQAAGIFDDIDWSFCTMGWVNHRAVPLQDPTSTEYKAGKLFLDQWKEKGLTVFSLTGTTDAVAEAAIMNREFQEIPKWDMQLIGVGLDGHIGSLYPQSDAIATPGRGCIPVIKKDSSSITMTLEEILNSDEIIVACCGKSEKYPLGKAEGMKRALQDNETKESFPASALREKATWLLDEGAAALLK